MYVCVCFIFLGLCVPFCVYVFMNSYVCVSFKRAYVCMRVYLRKRFFCSSVCLSNANTKTTGQDSAHVLVGKVNAVNSGKTVKSHV